MDRKSLLHWLFTVIVFIAVGGTSFAAVDPLPKTGFSTHITYAKSGKVDSYTLLVPQTLSPKTGKDYKVVTVSRVPDKYYQKGMIDVKTKTKLDNGKDNLLQGSSALKHELASIGVSNIKPFATAVETEKYPAMKEAGLDRIYTLSIPEDADPLAVCAELMLQSDVEYACPVYIRYTNHTPNDPQLESQYSLTDMHMYDAWDVTKGSAAVTIAVVDTGVDIDHTDLAANIYTNPGEVAGDNIDNDGNGYVDDVHGWDFAANVVNGSVSGESNNPRNSVNTHGTSVAGCASAATNNGRGIAGIGYNCKILPVKCGSTNQNYGGIYRGYEGIRYAAKMKADVINCSWGGGGYSASEQETINYAISQGSIVVVSSGNDGTDNDNIPTYPANYDGVLSVGATTQNYGLASFSNYGYKVTTYAPGSRIYTTDAGNNYTTIDGTSFSSPNVAGVCGLLKSLHSSWTPQQILHQIRSTSDKNISINGKTYYQIFGSVNAYKAVSSNNVPGIGVVNYTLNYGDAQEITNNDEYIVTAKIKNYLGSATNLKVTPVSVDGSYVVVGDPIEVGTLGMNATQEVAFTLSLTDQCPWYLGHVNVLLTYEAQGYTDCELLQIPVRMSSENVFSMLYNLYDTGTKWQGMCAPSATNVWAIGYGGIFTGAGYLKLSGNSLNYKDITNYPLYNIGAADANVAYAGGGYNNQGYMYVTSDGGANWGGYNLTNQTKFVNDVVFFDNLYGVMLCDPLSTSEWDMFFTKDGGNSLSYVKLPFNAQSGETGNSGTATILGNNIWFGSNKGRTFHSGDRGTTWSAYSGLNGSPAFYAFRSALNGAVIYGSSNAYYFAVTSDGGQTWSSGKSISFSPRHMYAIDRSMAYYVVNYDGAVYFTQDEGTTWKPVQTYRTDYCVTATNFDHENGTNDVFMLGSLLGRLSHKYTSFNAKPSITFNDGASIDFGSVEVSKIKSKFVKYTNNGEASATIASVAITPKAGTSAGEFTCATTPATTLVTGATQSLLVKFNPNSEGAKSAVLTVSYNGTPTTVSITLTGTAKAASADTSASLTFGELESIAFPDTKLGKTSTQTVTINNTGAKAINITGFNFTNDSQGEFSVTEKPTISVAANSSKTLTLTFAPKTVGNKTAAFAVTNDGDDSPVSIPVTAVGIDSAAGVTDVNSVVKAYPNPAYDYTVIPDANSGLADAVSSIEIYNSDGKFIRTNEINYVNGGLMIKTGDLVSGMYNIVLVRGKYRETLSIIVLN